MELTLRCETCGDRFVGGLGASWLWSNWHDVMHKREHEAAEAKRRYVARRARRAFGWRGMR